MTDVVQLFSQAWQWCDQMYVQHQAWFLPGVLVLLALIGLTLLYSELHHSVTESRKWRRSPLGLRIRNQPAFRSELSIARDAYTHAHSR